MKTIEIQKKILLIIKSFDKICKENDIWYTLTSGSVLGAVRHQGFIPWDTDMDVFVNIDDLEKLRNVLLENIPKEMKLYVWDSEPKYPLCFDRISFVDTPHDLVHLDIFPLIGAPNDKNKQQLFVNKCFYSFKILRTKHVDTKFSKPSNVRKINIIKKFTKLIPDVLIRKWYHHLESKYNFEETDYIYTIASGYGLKECLPKELIKDTTYVDFEDTKLPIPIKYDEYLTRVYGDYMMPKKDGYKL